MNDVKIKRLGHLGDGIADGPVYVPGALPGETVRGRQEGDVLTDTRILTPSPDRVVPPCRHFKTCGGCQMQHLSDAALAGWKIGVVANALKAHDLETAFLPMAVSPSRSRRRATLAARRTKKGAMAGFYGKRSEVITEIPDCQLLHPALMGALPVARALAQAGASRKAALRVAATVSQAGLDIDVSGGKPLDGALRQELAQIADAHDLARVGWGGETLVTRRPPAQDFDGIRVVPPPGAFLQATKEGEIALRRDVMASLGGAAHVVDLFAGCGTFALPVARYANLHAVEGEATMTESLERAWREGAGLKQVSVETRDLFRRPLMADELAGFDAAVIDPPRAGAEAQIAELAHSGIPVIAHVSCNPVSFARDAAMLQRAGYDLTHLRIVDQFSWSLHVELVAEFRRRVR